VDHFSFISLTQANFPFASSLVSFVATSVACTQRLLVGPIQIAKPCRFRKINWSEDFLNHVRILSKLQEFSFNSRNERQMFFYGFCKITLENENKQKRNWSLAKPANLPFTLFVKLRTGLLKHGHSQSHVLPEF
jgi:hypothetical protein